MLLVSGGSATVERHVHSGVLGVLLTPTAGNSVTWATSLGVPWAVDNAAFSGFDEAAYLRLLDRLGENRPLWVTAPDVVGDAIETLRLFRLWAPRLRERGLRVALVAQDGLEPEMVPWSQVDCIFVGGSTEWKLSESARVIIEAAKEHGKMTHIGRVNTRKRIQLALDWGVDSIDGTAFSMYPDTYIPKGIAWIREHESFLALNRRIV